MDKIQETWWICMMTCLTRIVAADIQRHDETWMGHHLWNDTYHETCGPCIVHHTQRKIVKIHMYMIPSRYAENDEDPAKFHHTQRVWLQSMLVKGSMTMNTDAYWLLIKARVMHWVLRLIVVLSGKWWRRCTYDFCWPTANNPKYKASNPNT